MPYSVPWSSRHKKVTGGLPFSLSNSFAEPLSNKELIERSLARDDQNIVDEYHNHSLEYTPNGGSLDVREEIANLYGPKIQLIILLFLLVVRSRYRLQQLHC